MKICFIAHLGDMSGANHSLVELTKTIQNLGIEVLVIVPRKGPLTTKLSELNIDYKIIFAGAWIGNKRTEKKYKKFSKVLINKLAEFRYYVFFKKNKSMVDIVHYNSMIFGVGAKSLNKLKIPYVWHIRELPEDTFGLTFYNKKYSYEQISKSKKIFAISKTIKEKFNKDFGNDQIALIYNGINIKNTLLETNENKSNEKENISLLIVGAVAPDKGQFEAVKAVGYLVNKRMKKGIILNIVGKIVSREYYNEISDFIALNNLTDHIVFHGYYTNVEYFRKTNKIALVCSKMEAFGRVTVEAMISEQLTIGANTGGTAELINHMENGLLYKQGDYKDLSKNIEWAIDNQQNVNTILENGKNSVIDLFSIERTAMEVVNQYKQINKNRN